MWDKLRRRWPRLYEALDLFDKGESDMIPTNLEAQTRSAHLEKLHGLVAFFEQQIGKSLEERNFRLARSWHASLSGAYMLAKRLGLEEPDHRDRENMWFECIQAAEFGPRRKE